MCAKYLAGMQWYALSQHPEYFVVVTTLFSSTEKKNNKSISTSFAAVPYQTMTNGRNRDSILRGARTASHELLQSPERVRIIGAEHGIILLRHYGVNPT